MAIRYGTIGLDVMNGTAADDVLHGGPQADPAADIGADTLSGEAGNDELLGYGGEDRLYGGDGNDRLFGHLGDDLLDGGAGDDWLDGGLGDDLMQGGLGNDLYIVDSKTDRILELPDGGVDEIRSSVSWIMGIGEDILRLTGSAGSNGFGNDADNTLIGNNGNNSLSGGGGADILLGGGGRDRLDGGAGDDRMEGGLGDDTYVVDSLGDVLIEAANAGIDTIETPFDWVLGGDFENLVLTGEVGVHGTGNAADNRITGNAAANRLLGLAGDDWLDGRAGADRLEGGQGNDTYVVDQPGDQLSEAAGQGHDTVRSSVTWALGGAFEDLSLLGFADIDGTGNAQANRLIGNAGANTLLASGGDDVVDGGAGNDLLNGGVGDDLLHGGSGDDILLGSSGNDLLEGGDGNDLLEGGAGDDWLDGGARADTLLGGAGNDTYVVDRRDDRAVEDPADAGIDTVRSSVSWTLGEGFEHLVLTGTAGISGFGNALANTMDGNAGANRLEGAAGDDTLRGGGGNDRLLGGEGVDWLEGGEGDDQLEGGAGNDTLLGGAGNDRLLGGDDRDWMEGGDGDDWLDGGRGVDRMFGGAGNDRLIGDKGNDVLEGGAGNDRLEGGADNDTLYGGAGNDWLDGGAGADVMDGGEGLDTYVIDDPGDRINGFAGDTIYTPLDFLWDSWLEHYYAPGLIILTGSADSRVDGLNVVGNSGDNLLRMLDDGRGTLYGGDGDDVLRTGYGHADMYGGAGDDTYYFDASIPYSGDIGGGSGTGSANELPGEGTDSIIVYAPSLVYYPDLFVMGDNIENITVQPGNIFESFGLALTANAEDNVIVLEPEVAGTIDAGAGDDHITAGFLEAEWGGHFFTTITGGAGLDTFRVTGWTSWGLSIAVTDFAPGADRLVLEAADFGLTSGMDLAAEDRFAANAEGLATSANGSFIYDTDDFALYWDADGTGSGEAYRIVQLSASALGFSAGDIVLV